MPMVAIKRDLIVMLYDKVTPNNSKFTKGKRMLDTVKIDR